MKARAQDTTDPTITLTGANPVSVTTGTTYSDPGATCTDDTDASPTLATTSSVDTLTAGTYQVTYTCTDSSSNTATATRDVVVADAPDTTAPTLSSIERHIPTDQNTGSQTLVYQVTFSENVTGVDVGDFVLSPDSPVAGGASGQFTQTSEPAIPITDRSTIQDAIAVDQSGTATSVSVAVDITHTYIGDLVIDLIAPDGTAQTLHDRTGSSANDIDRAYTPDLGGAEIAGDWTLRVSDRAGGDTGTLNSWTLTIGHGTADSPVTGLTGSGDTYLVTVSAAQDGTYNLDLVSPGHGITDDANNPLSSPTPTGADHTYTVGTIPADTTAPTLASIERYSPADQNTDSQTLVYKVTFSEDVTGVDAADFALSSGGTGTGSVANLAGSGSQYLVTVSAAQDGTYNLDLVSPGHGITDDANNPLSSPTPTGADHTYTVGTIPADTTAPTLASIERYSPADQNTDSQTLVYKVTFSEDVTGVDAADFALSSGGTGTGSVANLAGSGSQYLVTVSAAQDGTYNLDLVSPGHGITDDANNPLSSSTPTGADHTYTVSTIPADTTAPTLASIERYSPADQNTDSQTLVYKVTFSEDVTGVDAADFALSSGGTGTGSVTNLAGSGSQYLVTVSAAQDGTYNLDLVQSGHGIADTANNPLSSPTPTGADHTYTVTLQVTIVDSPNNPPVVGAGADQEVAEGATVTLSGTASDDDPEDTLTYSWTHDSTLTITITGSDSLSASFTAPDVAANTTITVTLTVNDGTVEVSDALQVTIADSPSIPPAPDAGLNLTAAGSITDTDTLELLGARGITTFESGGSTYAAVIAYFDNGVQILDVTDPSDITAAGSIADDAALKLAGASGIAVFESGGSTYAAVASLIDDGVQILDVTDPSDITAAGGIADTATLELLLGASGITTFESGGSTYAAVASFNDDGVQILDVTDPSDITAAGSITDTATLELDGARAIATFESGGSTYAAVASLNDDGVQILDVTDPSAITAAGSIGDTATLKLDGAYDITVFESGGSTYAAVASSGDNGVQILDVTDPSDITAAGSIADTDDPQAGRRIWHHHIRVRRQHLRGGRLILRQRRPDT